ncbi:membrane-bound polysaccharide biosynthesis protein [Streptomyces noursei ZPM]|uniref:Membrane-bound polysaccharide biosynthesis protein n=1 Tax=Streptomyces noursei TaxID=1971 RepID=A0A401QV43_STRNR|nr:Wzz/FepE/Etk N-terminal domain-containing protein [Streptomyces noursei]AKA02053.1 membrane-bound polysaccharide biosynthesis protein [Streptomyces noursei ZPM]EOT00482.1 membrane-bound polysaccharide biosynthesis protein [Streptomyces noursei CCRC 11814]EXU92846.1 membrane-bound polysaccharide biosynthesis protein [Streptomyces noursei PD-1]UWS70531.1 Wzz/FepE/Etk N-terminal domain-containing protein [Streptomyces noursei]GCB89254.1 membrane-bound polysaccharide biosynthesis protein [Strep
MTTRTTSQSSAAAPLLDLQALVVAVRRRRRLWCAMALLGLLVGAAVAVLLPTPPTAVTKVLVAHKEDQPNDPGTLIRTDVALLGTTRIAGEALKSLKSPEKPADFLRDYQGTGLTNNLLQIDVTGHSDAEAVARAKALAEAFVADHVRRMWEAAKTEAKALDDQRDRLRDELAQVNKAIGDRAPGSDPKDSASLESRFARRAELTSRIADFDQRAEEARTGTPQVIAGTQIVDAPRALPRSLAKAALTHAAVGLVLGLVLGLALAAVGVVVADRPVLRRDIAANLGASVIAELPRRSGRPWQRRRIRTARERLVVSLARTVRGSAEPVSLLELGCARSTSALALDLAGSLAPDGPVVVVDGLPGPQLAGRRRKPGGPSVVGGEPAAAGSHDERRFGVGSVAPGTAWTDLQYLGTRTVLVVRAGHGNAAWLHTVARQLADQQIAVLGVVLIDPDPRDRTDGTLWDGLQTALRGRSERPARQNGGGTSHAVQAVGEGRPRAQLQPMCAARVPDNDQEAR